MVVVVTTATVFLVDLYLSVSVAFVCLFVRFFSLSAKFASNQPNKKFVSLVDDDVVADIVADVVAVVVVALSQNIFFAPHRLHSLY